MKKIYLVLMLLAGCIGSKLMAQQPSITYDFGQFSADKFDLSFSSSTFYSEFGTGSTTNTRLMCVLNDITNTMDDNSTGTMALHGRIAVGSDDNKTDWWMRSWCLQNKGSGNRLLSVLKLRAGEVVAIKVKEQKINENSYRGFVDAYSSNAIYGNIDDIVDANDSHLKTLHYVMKEDGHLDLRMCRGVEVYTITISSPYTNFVANKATTTNGINITNISNPWKTPVVIYRGDLNPGTVNVSNNGANVQISGITGRGGAVIVMSNETMMTYTIPYQVSEGSKAWNFWSNPLAIGRSEDPNSLQYRDNVGGYSFYGSTATSSETNQPSEYMTRFYQKINGQNAYYNEETAGLLIYTDENSYQYGYLNEINPDEHETSEGQRYLVLRKGGYLDIPGLKKGDQVYMYIDHYGGATTAQGTNMGSALALKVTNAQDALKNDIPDGHVLCTGGSTWGPNISDGNWLEQYYSALHFYAKKDGDMLFQVDGTSNACYARIAYIRIYRNEQDLIMPTNNVVASNGWEFLTTQDPDGTLHPSNEGIFRMHTVGRGSSIQRFEVREPSGNLVMSDLTSTLTSEGYSGNDASNGTNPCYFKFQSASKKNYGCFLLRGKDYDHDGTYCVDYADRIIAVGFLQTMNYPYTWDLTDVMSSTTGNSDQLFRNDIATLKYGYQTAIDSTKIWQANADGGYDLYNSIFPSNNRNWCSGSQLNAGGEIIEEAAGLGIATLNQSSRRTGDFNISSEGLRIKPEHSGYSRIFIPGLPSDKACKIYIRGYKYTGGVGFAAKYQTGAAIGGNKLNPETVFTEIDLGNEASQTSELFNLNANFTEYDGWTEHNGENGGAETDVELEENILTVKATSSKKMTFASAGTTVVDNTIQYALFKNGEGSAAVVDAETGEVITPAVGVTDKNGSLIYDSDIVSLTDDPNEYTNLIKTGGTAGYNNNVLGRAIEITGLPSHYKLTIVAKSQNSRENRQIGIYSGTGWGGSNTLLAKMNVLNKALSKSIEVQDGGANLYIGSLNSGVEFYAIYVEEISNQTVDDTKVPYAGYATIPANSKGVTLYLSDILIEKIAVSTDEKSVNIKGYASESRDHYIDHSLTNYFCNVPVKAYTATIENGDYTKVMMHEVTNMELTSADGNNNTGCILYSSATGDDKSASFNLFVPDIHDYLKDSGESNVINQNFIGNTCTNSVSDHSNADQTKIATMGANVMIGVVNGISKLEDETTESGITYVNYVLQYKYTDYYENNQEGDEKLYRVNRDGVKLGLNKAYARFDKSIVGETHYGYANGVRLSFDDDEDNVDAIDDIADGLSQDGETDIYYTLSGVRINKPTKSGVYVKNGKKVYIK